MTMKKRSNMKDSALSLIKTFIYAIILAFLIKTFIFNTTLVMGQSMEPTLYQNDRLICLVYPLYFNEPDKGDIVVIEAPDNLGEDYIKRVIGTPGDIVEIYGGNVYVNTVEIQEDYVDKGALTDTLGVNKWELGEGEIFVLGDNRYPGKSADSRYFGPVTVDDVKSIAVFRYAPLNSRFGKID